MIVAVTGHRPNKLGGYRIPNPTFSSVLKGLDQALLQFKPTTVITGMALGVDQWMAELCIYNDVPFIAALPFDARHFESRWPPNAQNKFRELLRRAQDIVVVSPGEYSPRKMQSRNEWMVDRAEQIIAVYNGDREGGTFNCITYASSINKPIYNVPFIAPPRVESRELQRNIQLRPASEVLGERRIIQSRQRQAEQIIASMTTVSDQEQDIPEVEVIKDTTVALEFARAIDLD